MDTVNYVNTVYDISESKLSLENINFIIKFKNFDPVEVEDDIDEDIIQCKGLLNSWCFLGILVYNIIMI